MNAVVLAVGLMLVLSLCRVHVVLALIIGAVVGGLFGGLGLEGTLKAFNGGLGGGATVALSYAMLGAFAVAIARSGVAHALADKVLACSAGTTSRARAPVRSSGSWSACCSAWRYPRRISCRSISPSSRCWCRRCSMC